MTEIIWTERTMIVPEALVAAVQGLTSTWEAGQGMLLTGMCPVDSETQEVTHRKLQPKEV